MSLRRLTLLGISGSVAGFLLVLAIVGYGVERGQAYRDEIAELMVLARRADVFSARSDAMVLGLRSPAEWEAYLREASALERGLRALPVADAARAVARVGELRDTVERARDDPHPPAPLDAGVLALERRLLMEEVAALGVSLDAAVNDLLEGQQQALAAEHRRLSQWLLVAVVVFGLLAMTLLIVIQRRVLRPLRWLHEGVCALERGEAAGPVPESGSDEVSALTRTFNRTLSRQRQYQELVERSEDHFAVADDSFRYVLVNSAYAAMYGVSPAAMEGRPVAEVLGERYFRDEVRPRLQRCFAGEPQRYETERVHPVLGRRRLLVRYFPMIGESPRLVGAVMTDVTEEYRIRERLERHEAELQRSGEELARALDNRQALINALPAHIAVLDSAGNILDVNEQWRHFGSDNGATDPHSSVGANYLRVCRDARGPCAEEADTVAEGLSAVLAGQQPRFFLEYPCHAPDTPRWFRMMATGLAADGGEAGVVVMHVDITERKLAEQQRIRLAYEDRLTGLYHRNGFLEALEERFAASDWDAAGMVVVLDLIGQHDINETHGYEVGDRLLAEVGRRLQACAGEGAVVARIGGDEFALYLPGVRPPAARQRRRALSAVFAEPMVVDALPVEVNTRFGYTLLAGRRREARWLLREAELAMFEARKEDVRQWALYSRATEARTGERIRLTGELRQALERDELELHFQPQVDLYSGRMVACEALVRWNHPQEGLVPPARFIPVAEQSQLIIPLGDWVFAEACRQLRAWRDEGLEIVRVSVNASVAQLRQVGFPRQVSELLERTGLEPDALTLEVTESVFEHHWGGLRRTLLALHDAGIRLALDDFGTGYSSLLYLQRYPFDEIKVDQAFVRGMERDALSRRIVASVLELATALGADTVAEGIEQHSTAAALLAEGCSIGQGYLYSPPLAAEDFRWLLRERSALPLRRGG
ncbi:EAL domain-containing protein [Arhodomonas sp. SL1]|uniref:EAL domain-containing protein n=1 Tax=Arhodomonas sp. SL1 TaxID=3425691 RepID=UPI003F8815AF